MNNPAVTIRRGLRSEWSRTARGALWRRWVPVAVLAPLAVTGAIATVAEHYARIPGQQYVEQVETSNSVYWVLILTVMIMALATIDGYVSEIRQSTIDHTALGLGGHGWVLATKWVFYGLVSALVAGLTGAAVMAVLPRLYPSVYGEVSLTSAAGIRFLWTIPIYAVATTAVSLGLASLLRTTAAAGTLLMMWVFVGENAVGLLPNGYTAQQYLPFLNAQYATGQQIILAPPWGPNQALALFAAFGCVVLGIGSARTVFDNMTFPYPLRTKKRMRH